jgi:hypothetical protein
MKPSATQCSSPPSRAVRLFGTFPRRYVTAGAAATSVRRPATTSQIPMTSPQISTSSEGKNAGPRMPPIAPTTVAIRSHPGSVPAVPWRARTVQTRAGSRRDPRSTRHRARSRDRSSSAERRRGGRRTHARSRCRERCPSRRRTRSRLQDRAKRTTDRSAPHPASPQPRHVVGNEPNQAGDREHQEVERHDGDNARVRRHRRLGLCSGTRVVRPSCGNTITFFQDPAPLVA